MNKLNNEKLKLAIQKDGRLTQDSLSFLRLSGLEFESGSPRLFTYCRNFPLEILYVRDDDIPDYVERGVVDLGIIGQNILYEKRPKVKKLLNLRFGFCSLVVAIPKESSVKDISALKNKRIATSYPNSTKIFFKKNKINIETIQIKGSVEITPVLGVADAIVDLTSTGSTLALNDLKRLTKIYDCEAVLIADARLKNLPKKRFLTEKLMARFKGFLSAKQYKLVLMNVEEKFFPRVKKILPAIKSSIVNTIGKKDSISLQCVMKEDILWETINKLKENGVTQIFVLPVEKMII